MINIHKTSYRKLESKMLLQVHDELVLMHNSVEKIQTMIKYGNGKCIQARCTSNFVGGHG
jgi:DNA polymerase I-like protein with 3'-5' exonuclease and polymerase domains